MDEEPTPEAGSDGESSTQAVPGLTISWPSVAIGLAVVAGSTLATLVTVVTVKGIDLLSTVALALAILAFIAQLVGSWSQAQSFAQTSSDTHRINAETKSVLSQIRTQSESLISNQKDHVTEMLRALIEKGAVRDAVAESSAVGAEDSGAQPSKEIDTDALVRSLESRLLWAASPASQGRASGSGKARYANFVSQMESFPATREEGAEGFAVLNSLRPIDLMMLVRRAHTDLANARAGRPPRAFAYASTEIGPSTKRLQNAGLLKFESGKMNGEKVRWRSLTPLGREVARYGTAKGAWPQWLKDEDRAAG